MRKLHIKGSKSKFSKKEIPKAINSRKLSYRNGLKKNNFGTANTYSSREKLFGLNKESKGCNNYKNLFQNISGKDIGQEKNNKRMQNPRKNFSASKIQINENSNNKTKRTNNTSNSSNNKSNTKSNNKCKNILKITLFKNDGK
jgi:hypothetical protein